MEYESNPRNNEAAVDRRYVDVAVQRWQTLTGKQATHDADGRSFEEIARERGMRGCIGKGADGDE